MDYDRAYYVAAKLDLKLIAKEWIPEEIESVAGTRRLAILDEVARAVYGEPEGPTAFMYEESFGKTLYARKAPNFGRVIDPRYVGMMNAMMHETVTSGTAHAAQLPGWPAAGKTGTSQEFRDAWFIGYTSHLVTGVWIGNDDSTPMKKATGSGMPVDIWSRFMKAGHQGVPVADLPNGEGADVLVAGTATFSGGPSAYAGNIRRLRPLVRQPA